MSLDIFVSSALGPTMWTCTTLSRPIGKTVLHAALALLCPNGVQAQETQLMQPAPPEVVGPTSQRARLVMEETGVRIERVDFVLDQASQPRTDEAQKKRKAEQRAAAARAKRNAKAASDAASPASGASRQAAGAPTTTSASSAAGLPAAPAASTPAAARPATAPAPSVDTLHNPSNPSEPQQTQANASPQVHGHVAAPNAGPGVGPNAGPVDQRAAGTGRPPRLTRDQLLALVPGSTMLRTNTSGALRQWVNKPDGTLTVYWGGGGVRNGAHSASGNWNVTDEGRLCLHIDWENIPENWCRFIERTANGDYQPIADIADANWTPPADQTYWRPLTIRH